MKPAIKLDQQDECRGSAYASLQAGRRLAPRWTAKRATTARNTFTIAFMDAVYDKIGVDYTSRRSPDSRIFHAIRSQFGEASSLVNLGAGSGSYEPEELDVIAVEPSSMMISQRPVGAPPVVQAVAENLPFVDNSFDLAMGLLTLHHWADWDRGLKEAARVSGGNVLLLTWFGSRQRFWLADYFPIIAELDNARFPPLQEYERVLGDLEVTKVPIPHDCTDGFMCAYWRRPEAYLDPLVRSSISTFSMIPDQEPALRRLESDLNSGRWEEIYGELLTLDSFDHGYRILRSGSSLVL